MSKFLRWPDDFNDPAPVTGFDVALVALFDQMIASGATVHADRHWSLFGFDRGARRIDFIRRGSTRKLHGRFVANRELFWEVLPVDGGVTYRLGQLFGIRDYACVVVSGITDLSAIATRWLDGIPLRDAVDGIDFWDRCDPSSPLEIVA